MDTTEEALETMQAPRVGAGLAAPLLLTSVTPPSVALTSASRHLASPTPQEPMKDSNVGPSTQSDTPSLTPLFLLELLLVLHYSAVRDST